MFWLGLLLFFCFPGGSAGKESPCSAENAKDAGTIPGLERSPGEGNANLPVYEGGSDRLMEALSVFFAMTVLLRTSNTLR